MSNTSLPSHRSSQQPSRLRVSSTFAILSTSGNFTWNYNLVSRHKFFLELYFGSREAVELFYLNPLMRLGCAMPKLFINSRLPSVNCKVWVVFSSNSVACCDLHQSVLHQRHGIDAKKNIWNETRVLFRDRFNHFGIIPKPSRRRRDRERRQSRLCIVQLEVNS